jgi:hypothetical protein
VALEEMQPRDVERIVRDVLNARGIEVSLLHVEPTSAGWRVTVNDVADRALVTELHAAGPALVRQGLIHWVEAST